MNHSEPTSLSIQLGKIQGETAIISVFRQETDVKVRTR